MALNPMDRVVRDISDIKRQLAGRSQLNHSSLENTAIPVYDGDGIERLRIGAQDDGTHSIKYVQGPPPPRPTAPVVSVDGPVVRVRWDGMLLGGHIPEDFSRIDVHFALASEDLEADEAVRGNLATSAGNETVLAATQTGTYRVGLVAMSQSRARSEMSEVVDVEVELVNLKGALDAVVDNASGGQNHYSPTKPPGTDHDPDRDLWFDTSVDAEGLVSYSPHRWDENLQDWVSLEDERTQAIQDAQREFESVVTEGLNDAQQAAGNAQHAADDAMTEAETAREEATSKAQAAQQAAEAHADAVAEAERLAAIAAASDDASAKAAAAQAAAEVTAAADASAKAQAAQQAAEAKAQAAQDTADDAMARADDAHTRAGNAETAAGAAMQAATHNAKNLWSTSNPSGTAPRGTIWFKIDPVTRNVVGQWQQTAGSDTAFGSNWEKRQLTDALFDNIDAGKINTGYLDVAALIRAGAIQADKLLIGDLTNLFPDTAFANTSGYGVWSVVNRGLEQTGTGAQRGTYFEATQFSVKLGDPLYIRFVREDVTGGGGQTSLYLRQYSATGALLGTNSVASVTGSGVAEGTYTVARAGAAYCVIGLFNQNSVTAPTRVRITGIEVRRQVGSTLIEPGSINTPHLAAASITGESGILANLDAGVITYGFMSGARLEAGSVDTPQLAFGAATGDVLSVDALNFKTAVGLDIRGSSFRAGDAVEMTEDFGIRQFGPDGALNVSLPSDGSPAEFRGDLSARTLTATGRMSIQGPGAIASGGVLELESGVVPPVNPPGASTYLERTTFPTLADNEEPWGLAWADGSWWRAVNVAGTREGDRIERISPDGALLSSFPTDGDPRGLTTIGNELFLLANQWGTSGEDRWVFVYDLNGTLKRRWEYTDYGTGGYQPGIGTNGTDVVIAQTWSTTSRARTLTWRRYNPTNGALRGETHTSYPLSADVVGINITTADYGTQRVIVTTGRSTGAVEMYTTAGAQVDAGGWYANDRQQVRGTAWANGRFHHLTVEGNLVAQSTTIYPNGAVGPDTNDWWAALTWSDGTSETTIGPARRFTFMRRTDLRVSFGTPPEGASVARVYLARKTTEPSRADFHLVEEVPTGAGQATIILPTGWAQAETPPAANSFPNSTPGIIRSTLGQFEVDGTGAGRWGPLTFNADGTMSSSAVPDWIPVTTFRPGFGPQTWGFVPAYRIWPDGKVEWRGVIAGSVTTTVAALTVPIAARPQQPVNLLAATNAPGGADASTRIEFGQLTEPDIMRIYRGSADRTWVSLDGASYYLE